MDKVKGILSKIAMVLGVIFVLIIIAAIVDISRESEEVILTKEVSTEEVIVEDTPEDIPEIEESGLSTEYRTAFIEGCYDGTNMAYCLCVIDYMEDNYSSEEIIIESLLVNANEDYIPDMIYEGAAKCIIQLH